MINVDIKDVIVFSNTNRLVKEFTDYFKNGGYNIIDFRALHLGRALGVLVCKRHPLFQKYYSFENFNQVHFDSGESIVRGLVDFEYKKYYSKEEVAEMVVGRFEA